jgi:NAD(P)-dependent dehydrogenase (short-subunit alcohol dehydrogenase family)
MTSRSILLVTGGAGHLGLAAVQALFEHGASGILIFDLLSTLVSAQSEIQRLQAEFPQAKLVVVDVDVTDEKKVKKSVEEAKSTLGSIDMLLCFAGVVANTHAVDVTPAEWRRVLEINTTGSWLCAQAASRCIVFSSGDQVFLYES